MPDVDVSDIEFELWIELNSQSPAAVTRVKCCRRHKTFILTDTEDISTASAKGSFKQLEAFKDTATQHHDRQPTYWTYFNGHSS